jgi:primosomal protein N'
MKKQMYYQVLVKNYPSFSNQTFTYSSNEKLSFGSRVLVPFGPYHQVRQGIILYPETFIEQSSLPLQTEIPKEVHSVLETHPQIHEKHFSFFQFASLYNLIPIHSIFLRAGLFAAQWNPLTFYQIHFDQLDKLQYFRQRNLLENFLNKHPSGFTLPKIQRALKIRKNSTILKKLETLGIVDKTYQPSKETLPSEVSSVVRSNNQSAIFLLNGYTPPQRLDYYRHLIQSHYTDKEILIIVPNNMVNKVYKKAFGKMDNVEIGSRDRVFEPQKMYDLLIVEDSTSQEYQLEVPFYIHIEKMCIMRSQELAEQVLFGSYLPSVLSYSEMKHQHCKHIQSLDIKKEYITPPKIQFLDMKREIQDHGYSLIPFSIQKTIQQTLQNGKKVLLYLNRKGYYNSSICTHCGHIMKCPVCNVPLSYQPITDKLTCRYCGYAHLRTIKCPECQSPTVVLRSPGTNKIEEFSKLHFPEAHILRIDRSSPNHTIEEIEESNMYIGTQKVFQKLLFPTIDVVIFLEIDSFLNTPSFASQEKVLQSITHLYEALMINDQPRSLYIPTYAPKSELFRCIQSRTLRHLYETELQAREDFRYPPFVDMMEISIHHKEQEIVVEKTKELKEQIKTNNDITIVSEKLLVGKSPHGIFQSSIVYRSNNAIEAHKKIALLLDETNKTAGIRVHIRNLE